MRWALLLFLLAACGVPPRPPVGEGPALVVGYTREADVERAAEWLSARSVEWLPALKAARLRLPPGLSPEEARGRLRSLGLRYVEEEGQRDYRPLPEALGALAVSPYAWHLEAVRAEGAWGVSTGAGVQVAVLDTGVDATHPALRGRVLEGLDAATGLPLPPDADESLGEMHGTHVAGLVVGDGIGVAPGALLRPVRVFSPHYVGDFQVAQAIVWVVDRGARVLNLSFGGTAYSYLLHEAINYALERLVVVVAAAGNQGSVARFYPAGLPGVIAVGAADGQGNPAWFSNRGPWVGVWAPGVRIYSAIPGGGYSLLSGTSMASPIVSGVVALIKALNPFVQPFHVYQALKAGPGPDALLALQASGFQQPVCLYLRVLWEGVPALDVDITLVGPGAFFAKTNAQGEVRFLQLPPGAYKLTLALSTPQGRRFHEQSLSLSTSSSCLLPLTVSLP
ncbi:S8 family serine peptidase [Thermus sp. FJN-A]